jgi:hypothetical protein
MKVAIRTLAIISMVLLITPFLFNVFHVTPFDTTLPTIPLPVCPGGNISCFIVLSSHVLWPLGVLIAIAIAAFTLALQTSGIRRGLLLLLECALVISLVITNVLDRNRISMVVTLLAAIAVLTVLGFSLVSEPRPDG